MVALRTLWSNFVANFGSNSNMRELCVELCARAPNFAGCASNFDSNFAPNFSFMSHESCADSAPPNCGLRPINRPSGDELCVERFVSNKRRIVAPNVAPNFSWRRTLRRTFWSNLTYRPACLRDGFGIFRAVSGRKVRRVALKLVHRHRIDPKPFSDWLLRWRSTL